MDYKESSCILRDYILYYSICYLSNTGNSSHMCLCYRGTVSKRQMVDCGLSCNLDEAAWFSYFWNPEWSFHLHKVAWSQSEIWWCWSSHHLGVSGSTMLLGRGSTGDVSLVLRSLFIFQQVVSNLCLGRNSSADLGSEFQAAGPTQQTEMSAGEQGNQHLWKQHHQFNVIFISLKKKLAWLALELLFIIFPCACC